MIFSIYKCKFVNFTTNKNFPFLQLSFKQTPDILEKPTSLNLEAAVSAQLNPYRQLVEKYEALLEVQRDIQKARQPQPPSLQDELMNSGELGSFNKFCKDGEFKKSEAGSSTGTRRKTPTDFSEVETTSSGFSDETSNKATQTEERSGAFLCTIADGEDCKFTIYDDASQVDSRFRDKPKYRELFREIFSVLKRAAENKDEGEQLPLLDDQQPPQASAQVKVPPVTPATEDIPVDFDTQSIVSSVISEQSIVSECVTKIERKKAKAHKKQAAKEIGFEDENKPPGSRQNLEIFAIMNAKKKARRSRQRSKDKFTSKDGRDTSAASSINLDSVVESPPSTASGSPIKSSKKARRHHQMISTYSAITSEPQAEWNGHSLTIYNRNSQSSKQTPPPWKCVMPEEPSKSSKGPFKPSAAAQELLKLRKLDLSYAEVLRRSDNKRRK